MINIRGIANHAIQAINADMPATLQLCTGYVVNDAGKQTSTYDLQQVTVQVQSATSDDLNLMNNLNMDKGTYRSIYIKGNIDGINRTQGKGADMLVFNNQTWKIVQVIESWSNWCRVLVCRQ